MLPFFLQPTSYSQATDFHTLLRNPLGNSSMTPVGFRPYIDSQGGSLAEIKSDSFDRFRTLRFLLLFLKVLDPENPSYNDKLHG